MNVWIFQARPDRYDLIKEVPARIGTGDWWTVSRFRKKMGSGDPLLFWRSGDDAGIYATGEISGDAYYEEGEWRVRIKYDGLLKNPVLRAILEKDSLLKNLSIIRQPQGGNFRVGAAEWKALEGLIGTRQSKAPPSGSASAPKSDLILPEEVTVTGDLQEGAVRQISVNAYERNPEARQRCLAHYGVQCFICGFDFAAKYGEAGKGFIHVHHLTSLSEIGNTYSVDPILDLRPVCPNCHAIIHRRKRPYTIREVKNFLRSQVKLVASAGLRKA